MLVSLNHSINHFPWILSLSNISGFITHRSVPFIQTEECNFDSIITGFRLRLPSIRFHVASPYLIPFVDLAPHDKHLSFLKKWREKQACVCVIQCVPSCYANCLSSCVMCNINLSFYVSICLSICPSVYVSVYIHLGILPPTVAIPYRNCKATGGHPLGSHRNNIHLSIFYLSLYVYTFLVTRKRHKEALNETNPFLWASFAHLVERNSQR